MAKIIGYDEKILKKFTCSECGAIVQYAPNEVVPKLNGFGEIATDEGRVIKGLTCPSCGEFYRTNA